MFFGTGKNGKSSLKLCIYAYMNTHMLSLSFTHTHCFLRERKNIKLDRKGGKEIQTKVIFFLEKEHMCGEWERQE